MGDPSPTQQIDAIIKNTPDWRGAMLAHLRAVIQAADPLITEEVKWKKPSKPEGIAVWMRGGNICMADILKNAVRLTFPKGALLSDPKNIFNTRLDSKTVRAVDFFENSKVDEAGLRALVREAAAHNNAEIL
jgi:hypothetical protein